MKTLKCVHFAQKRNPQGHSSYTRTIHTDPINLDNLDSKSKGFEGGYHVCAREGDRTDTYRAVSKE